MPSAYQSAGGGVSLSKLFMIISIVVAAADNNVIGKDNKLLWHLPSDMKFFKATTWASVVIMGRKTFVSLGEKPLPGRKNILITRQKDYQAPEGVWIAGDIKEALDKAKQANCHEVFVIGGGEIYQQAMALSDRIYMTRVHTSPEGDTFFPAISEQEWKLSDRVGFASDQKHAYAFDIEKWERI